LLLYPPGIFHQLMVLEHHVDPLVLLVNGRPLRLDTAARGVTFDGRPGALLTFRDTTLLKRAQARPEAIMSDIRRLLSGLPLGED
jgi:hypothetical protein